MLIPNPISAEIRDRECERIAALMTKVENECWGSCASRLFGARDCFSHKARMRELDREYDHWDRSWIVVDAAGMSFADLAQLAGAARTGDSVHVVTPVVERLPGGGVKVSFEIPLSAIDGMKRSQDGEGPSLAAKDS
jgi:hypothetical protein